MSATKKSLSDLSPAELKNLKKHLQDSLRRAAIQDAWFFRTQDELASYDGMDIQDIPLEEVSEDLRQLILENRTSDN